MKHKKLVGYGVALLLFVCLLLMVDLSDLTQALKVLGWRDVVSLLALALVMIYVSALKWKLFLDELGNGEPVSVWRLFALYFLGYFVNFLMPSYIGGDVARSYYVGKKLGQHESLAATILERYTGLLAMVILALGFVWMAPGVTTQIRITVFVISIGLLVLTAAALSPTILKFIGTIPLLKPILAHLSKIQAALVLASRRPTLLMQAMVLSLVFHSLTVINTVFAGYAVGWEDPGVLQLFVVLPLILLVSALPLAPQGLGIQEGAFYFFLQAAGATPAQALGVAIVLRAKLYVLALGGGLVFLFQKKNPS